MNQGVISWTRQRSRWWPGAKRKFYKGRNSDKDANGRSFFFLIVTTLTCTIICTLYSNSHPKKPNICISHVLKTKTEYFIRKLYVGSAAALLMKLAEWGHSSYTQAEETAVAFTDWLSVRLTSCWASAHINKATIINGHQFGGDVTWARPPFIVRCPTLFLPVYSLSPAAPFRGWPSRSFASILPCLQPALL